jgi:hypothetical protein
MLFDEEHVAWDQVTKNSEEEFARWKEHHKEACDYWFGTGDSL